MLNYLIIFLKKIESKLKRKLINIFGYPVLYNINNSSDLTHKKRALLIYLVTPFLMRNDDPFLLNHQNLTQCKHIAAILGEFGYVVDVVDWEDERFVPSKDYDLLISHRINLNGMKCYFKKEPIKIYLSSVLNNITNNQNMRKRYDNLLKRRDCKIFYRDIYVEEMPFVKNADAIIGFGNNFVMDTWKTFFKGPVYSFYNYAYKTHNYLVESKDLLLSRKNFLFFASGCQIRKGLDLLLEVFPKHPDLHLYICSGFKNEKDFCRCYKKELYQTPNIHPVGLIRIDGRKYQELIGRCAYVILPSCSEGHPGSIVECMSYGLIPVVTKEAGIDTYDYGVTFKNDSLDEIEKTIIELSNKPEDWLSDNIIKTEKITAELFSEDAFLQRWRDILRLIISNESGNKI